MHWLEASPEQSVPGTPPIYYGFKQRSSQHSPYATVPDSSAFTLSQESQDSQAANVPGTPISQSSLPHFTSAATPAVFNRKSHYGTPLLEMVLLKSARKLSKDYAGSTPTQKDCLNTPQLEQTVPSTPKQSSKETAKVCDILTIRSPPIKRQFKQSCENLELFRGDEIFPK